MHREGRRLPGAFRMTMTPESGDVHANLAFAINCFPVRGRVLWGCAFYISHKPWAMGGKCLLLFQLDVNGSRFCPLGLRNFSQDWGAVGTFIMKSVQRRADSTLFATMRTLPGNVAA